MIKWITLALALLSFFVMPSLAFYSYSSALICSGPTCIFTPMPPTGGGGPPIIQPEQIQLEDYNKRPTNQLLALLTGNPEGNLRVDSPIIWILIALAVIITMTIRVKQKSEKGED